MALIKCPKCHQEISEQDEYCGYCGCKIAKENNVKQALIQNEGDVENGDFTDNKTEDAFAPIVLDDVPEETPANKLKRKKRPFILLGIVIVIIGIFILHSKWNIIMGYQNCKSGDYAAAVRYYAEEINEGNTNRNIIARYDALSKYLSAEEAYFNDDMGVLSQYIDALKSTQSQYPTKAEIDVLQEQYTKRSNEINSYDKSIEDITELFSDTSKINDIKTKCDELLKKNVTITQKNKLNDIKANVNNYIDIKNAYDKADYSGVVNKVSELPDTYKSYATKDSIENMRKEAQKVLDERERISTGLKAIREKFNDGNFDSAFSLATDLLGMNLTAEERKEVENIKTTSEQKIEEEKAAAEQAEREARQKMIDEAIKISATDLYEAFTTNKVGADNKYKGKTLLVTGTIYNVDKAWLIGTPYVTLKAGYVADGVTAYFSSDTSSQLTDLSQGQTVKILGKCGGRSLGIVTLNDCNIIN